MSYMTENATPESIAMAPQTVENPPETLEAPNDAINWQSFYRQVISKLALGELFERQANPEKFVDQPASMANPEPQTEAPTELHSPVSPDDEIDKKAA